MAKKELNFGKLGLPQKATVIKKEESTPNIELAIEKIHGDAQKGRVVEEKPMAKEVMSEVKTVDAPVSTPVAAKSTTKPVFKPASKVAELDEMMLVKKISMDLPLDVYKYLKINSFEQAITMKDYVLRLIEVEMKKSSK
jgi:peroxiredoxin